MNDKTRINRVVTRTGDTGETGLADGSRLAKDDARIEALGAVDELNAALGVLIARANTHQELLLELQQRLFDLGAELALPGHQALSESHVSALEEQLASLNDSLPALTEFVLPGGGDAGAWCHYCRTVARRAERALVAAHRVSPLEIHSLQWLNRLSDLLFVLARHLNREDGAPEALWQR